MAYREPAYNPAQAYSNPAAQGAWNAQQSAYGANTYSNRVELEKELAYNESMIASLKNELMSLRADYRDLDSLDRKLAANRAAIGDMGNARAHLGDIEGRRKELETRANNYMQWRWQSAENEKSRKADRAKQNSTDVKRLIGDIEDLYIAMPKDKETRLKTMAKIDRLQKELYDDYGVRFQPTKEMLGNTNEWSADEWALYKVQNTDKYGHWISDEAKKRYYDWKVSTAAEAEEKKKGANTPTTDEAAANVAALKTKYNKAIDKATPASRSNLMYDLATGKGSHTETVMVDGKSYTVTFTQSTDGKIIAKCGSVTREF